MLLLQMASFGVRDTPLDGLGTSRGAGDWGLEAGDDKGHDAETLG